MKKSIIGIFSLLVLSVALSSSVKAQDESSFKSAADSLVQSPIACPDCIVLQAPVNCPDCIVSTQCPDCIAIVGNVSDCPECIVSTENCPDCLK